MKNIYSFALALFISSVTFSQSAPEIEWQNTIGGNSVDILKTCFQKGSDKYFLSGYSFSNISDDKSENRIGGYDYWILQLDVAGNIDWDNTIGGTADDYLQAGIQTADGGFFFGGYSNSSNSDDKEETNLGYRDYWVVKTDMNGIIEWQNTIGGTGDDELMSIHQASDGGYFISGSSTSIISGDKTDPPEGDGYGFNRDYWVLKLDSIGNILWQNTIGGASNDELTTSAISSDGGILVGGTSFSGISGDKDEPQMSYDYWVVKLNSSGDISWQNTIGGSGSDDLYAMVETNDNNFLIGGTSSSTASGDKTETSSSIDYWILKLNSVGNIIWQNTIGGTGTDALKSIAKTNDGGFILGGYSNSGISGDKTEISLGLYDYWIVRIDSLGNVMWDKTIGGTSNDYCLTINQTNDNGYIIGGHSTSGISENKTEANLGFDDYWVIKLYPEDNTPCLNAPTDLFADFISPTTAKLHWSADPDAIKYKVQFRKSTEAVWTNTNATSNVKNLFSLEPSTTYKFRIKSLCGPGLTSDWSVVGTFTTSPLKEGEFISDRIEVTIYPNPNNGIFQLELTGIQTEENVSMRMFNLLGEEIYAEIISGGDLIQHTIKLNSNIENGMYFLEIKTGEKIYTEQIIISN